MDFNKNWTKEDNDKLRELIKEKKSVDYINNYFGNDKLFYHPNKKYYYSDRSAVLPKIRKRIDNYNGFINEIRYEELKTDFNVNFNKSKYFKNEFDYYYIFQTDSGNKYIIDFIYLKDTIGPYKDRDIYNISFTLEENRNLSDYKDYEKITFLNEEHEIIKRIIFIIKNFNTRFCDNCVYLIGETEDKRKINWYSQLIKDSFSNVIEPIGVSSFTNGLNAYYFEIVNKNM
jgi:hypothetical protein